MPISFLYTNIGRGHPFYLDGVAEELDRQGPACLHKTTYDVFQVSSGWSRMAWKAVRWLYRKGSSGGGIGRLYRYLRQGSDYNRPTLILRLLGRDLQKTLGRTDGPLVVAHSSLVGMLEGRSDLIYQHGELVTPPESVVFGADTVCVPTDRAAQPFLKAGYKRSQVLVTGLCIEPALLAQAEIAFASRLKRLTSEAALSGLFVSSGAEPRQHITALISSITSSMRGGGQALVLAHAGGRLEKSLQTMCRRENLPLTRCKAGTSVVDLRARCLLALYNTRRQESELAAELFAAADYLVAPPHERTNWALGLGLPMFALTPTVGPFAPLNLELLLKSGTAAALGDEIEASAFAATLTRFRRSGRLARMARQGWGRYDLNGFSRIAAYLIDRYY